MSGSGTRRRLLAGLAAAGVAALLALAGCTSGDGRDSGGGGSAAQVAPDEAAGGIAAPAPAGSARDTGTAKVELAEPALIRTAELSVRVDDVAGRARSAQDLTRAAGGSIAGDNRSGSGAQARAELVLKVPPGRLDGVLDQLGGLGEELQRSSTTRNVTEEVADVDSRVATMQASIARVRAILSRADRIGDVVTVEGELSRRVTELESLQARQRALAGQVAQATVTLHLVARDAAGAPADRGGFLGGLRDGWSAFGTTVGWLLTALGAVLPFLLVAVPLALAARWYVARQRRPTTPAAPAPAPPAA